MSIHDTKLSTEAEAAMGTSALKPSESVNLEQLEGLAGLVEDMTNQMIAKTDENLERMVRERLGANVTVDQAKGMLTAFAAL